MGKLSDESAAVSVIVPCRNGAAHLPGLLQSLVQQDFQGYWEVLVVDNCSRDGSESIAAQYSQRLNLKVVNAPQRANASYARNVGVRAASGEKLLFIDADDEVESSYVSAMATALDSHDFVTSRVDSVSLNPEWVQAAQGPPWQESSVAVFFDFLPAAGINIGIRRSMFESLGGFPEEFSGSQDIAFSWRVQLRTGATIHFVSEAVYRYRYRRSLSSLYWQSCNWGYSNVLLYQEFREHGMPGRSLKVAIREWIDVTGQLLRVHSKGEVAPLMVRLGYCVGRIKGSIRYRVPYL